MKAARELENLRQKIEDGSLSSDEPIFYLRASDVLAPAVVEYWAGTLEQLIGENPKSREARSLAAQMRQWPIKKVPGRDAEGRAT
jgi:hypothetical protein